MLRKEIDGEAEKIANAVSEQGAIDRLVGKGLSSNEEDFLKRIADGKRQCSRRGSGDSQKHIGKGISNGWDELTGIEKIRNHTSRILEMDGHIQGNYKRHQWQHWD